MSHVAFRERGEDLRLEADYVVVGSGAGGAAAAVTLARSGAEVAIIEAGAWRDPEDYPSSTYGAMRDLFDDWGTQLARGRALWPIVQARTVGGTTVINSAICVRTPGDIFAQWQRERGIEGLAERVWAHQDTLERELRVEEVPEPARGNSNRLAMLGASRAGYDSHWIRRYVAGCEGTGQCLQGCKKTRKQSTNLNYVPEVLARGGHVVSSAPVKRVAIEGRRAIGVRGRFEHPRTKAWGADFFVRARRAVVVAASVTHSPALLERSGVRSPALGKYFRAHPGTGVFGIYDEPVDTNTGATQGWASTAFRADPGLKLETLSIPFEMVASRLSGGGARLIERLREYRHLCMWCHAVRAESVGTVRNGLFDKPVVRYGLDREDMLRFRQGMILLAKTHFAAGAKKILPGIHGMPYELGPDQVSLLEDAPLDPRAYIAILSHLFGGCVMGTDPRDAVTDARGRVHGYDGLVVADASVIPSNLGVNPQHTIMALAMAFAEDLASE
ncbi:MAG: GMC family oxidoreductase [Sandaracinaceae bacterium]|nr:GMC family oxidoreductase [Sandaracinaceae bacterium]